MRVPQFAVEKYQEEKNLPAEQMAVFEKVSDNVFDFGRARGIQNPAVTNALAGPGGADGKGAEMTRH